MMRANKKYRKFVLSLALLSPVHPKNNCARSVLISEPLTIDDYLERLPSDGQDATTSHACVMTDNDHFTDHFTDHRPMHRPHTDFSPATSQALHASKRGRPPLLEPSAPQ